MMQILKHRIRGFVTRKQALVLTYHSIQKRPLPFKVWHHLAAENFEAQIAYLASSFRCVPLSTLLAEMASGSIEPYTVAVTFDDGFRDNVTTAFPILQRYQVPATIFLTADFVGHTQLLWPEQLACTLALTTSPDLYFAGMQYKLLGNAQKGVAYGELARLFKAMPPNDIPQQLVRLLGQTNVTARKLHSSTWYHALQAMDWREAQSIVATGLIEIGAHTLTHRRLSMLACVEAEHEIRESKRILEQRIGPVHYFAYPYGESCYLEEHRSMARRAGYRAIFTTHSQTVTHTTDPYAIPRMGIGTDMSLDDFRYMLHGGAARAPAAY
jgi:peptidoglycan/xylan/chitin deacetylase (PgdA/CDA1 family)